MTVWQYLNCRSTSYFVFIFVNLNDFLEFKMQSRLANAFEYESHLEDVRDTPKQILIFESFHALLTSIETLADHKTKDIDEVIS